MMTRVSRLLIRVLGTRNYLRIPRRVRARLGMVCGDDFAGINAVLLALQKTAPVALAGGMTPTYPVRG